MDIYSHHSAREAVPTSPEAAVVAAAASASSHVVRRAPLQRLADVGGVLKLPVVVESASIGEAL